MTEEVTDRDRALASDAIRRGVPLGEVRPCLCFSMDENWVEREPCVGVCREAVERVAQAIATERERVTRVLSLILPLAKGYARQHPVGSNTEYVEAAEAAIAKGATQ